MSMQEYSERVPFSVCPRASLVFEHIVQICEAEVEDTEVKGWLIGDLVEYLDLLAYKATKEGKTVYIIQQEDDMEVDGNIQSGVIFSDDLNYLEEFIRDTGILIQGIIKVNAKISQYL